MGDFCEAKLEISPRIVTMSGSYAMNRNKRAVRCRWQGQNSMLNWLLEWGKLSCVLN